MVAYVVDGDEGSGDVEAWYIDFLSGGEQLSECKAVFSSAQSDKNMVTVLDEAVVGAGFVEEPCDAFLQLQELYLLLCFFHKCNCNSVQNYGFCRKKHRKMIFFEK